MSAGSDCACLNCHIGNYLHNNETEKIMNLLSYFKNVCSETENKLTDLTGQTRAFTIYGSS
jgi:hypothetical protein